MVLSETEQHWRESQQGRGRGLGCQAGEGRYEERKETELDYSALLGCWKSLMCSLQDSELLLSPLGDHLLSQTDPETDTEHGSVMKSIKMFSTNYMLSISLNIQIHYKHYLIMMLKFTCEKLC